MSTLAYALFDDSRVAAQAVETLLDRQFNMRDISVLLRDEPAGSHQALSAAVGAAGGTLVAAGAGGLLVAGHHAVDFPQQELTLGVALVGVITDDRERVDAARAALKAAGATEVHVRDKRAQEEETEQRIDEALAESFPASDPPFWTSGWNGPPTPTPRQR